MATARLGALQVKKSLEKNNSGISKVLAKTNIQGHESQIVIEKDYKGWKVHSKNLKTAKIEYLKTRSESLLSVWQNACQDAQKYIDDIEGGTEQHNTKINLWKKLLAENRWEILVEYLTKAEHAYKKNNNVTRWEEICKNARDFIDQIEPLSKKLTIKTDQIKAWKEILIGHSQRIFKAKQEISKKEKSANLNKSTVDESKNESPVKIPVLDKTQEAFLNPESTPLLTDIDTQLSTAVSTQKEIHHIHQIGTVKLQELLLGDAMPVKDSETSKKSIDPKIAIAQQKINDLVETLADNPTIKKNAEDFSHMDEVSAELDQYINRFTKKPKAVRVEDSNCCCSCWPFFKKKQISEEDQYNYQRLPSSPKPTKS